MVERQGMAEYPDSNEELALMAKDGDTVAATLLWEAVYGHIYRLMNKYKYLCNHCGYDLEDLYQCSWFVVLKAVEKYDPGKPAPFIAYLHHSVHAIAYQFFGRVAYTGRRPTAMSLQEDAHDGSEETLQDELTDPDAGPEERAERAEAVQAVHDALNLLDEKERQTVKLRFMDEMQQTQVAALMGCSRNWITILQARALKRLRAPDISGRLAELWRDVFECNAYKTGFSRFVARRGSSVELTVERLQQKL